MLLLATKLIEKIVDPGHAKELYNPYLKKKNTKLLKRSKIVTQQLKAIENSNAVGIQKLLLNYPIL